MQEKDHVAVSNGRMCSRINRIGVIQRFIQQITAHAASMNESTIQFNINKYKIQDKASVSSRVRMKLISVIISVRSKFIVIKEVDARPQRKVLHQLKSLSVMLPRRRARNFSNKEYY